MSVCKSDERTKERRGGAGEKGSGSGSGVLSSLKKDWFFCLYSYIERSCAFLFAVVAFSSAVRRIENERRCFCCWSSTVLRRVFSSCIGQGFCVPPRRQTARNNRAFSPGTGTGFARLGISQEIRKDCHTAVSNETLFV